MAEFNFENDLDHQTKAVESVVGVFADLPIEKISGV
ncbi:hypothetical protein NURINAE_01095 [Candidatus Nitrosacidococcus sp. I8]|nr:hypothetical protein NURINAE_01095 [Candidatus Nitrosacidococcus sp. I8]